MLSDLLAASAAVHHQARRVTCAGMTIAVAIAWLTGAALRDQARAEPAQTAVVVDQLTRPNASIATELYAFAPDLVRIPAGGTVRFLNSLGHHTVITQTGMLPDGAEPIAIRGQKSADVPFTVPGLYGLTCERHGPYGMVMLVIVGETLANRSEAEAAIPAGRNAAKWRALFARL